MLMTSKIPILLKRTVFFGLALSAISAKAATISVVASGAFVNTTTSGASNEIYTQAFNAGADAEMLVVSTHSDTYVLSSITYGGVAMTLVPGTATGDNRVRGIFTLANPSATGNLVATFNTPLNGNVGLSIGLAAISLNSSDGEAITVGATGFAKGFNDSKPTLTLNVPEADSFVYIAVGSNGGNTFTNVSSPLTEIGNMGVITSMGAAAGYQNGVAAGNTSAYAYTSQNTQATNSATITGASFHVIPEPSAALLGGLGMLALLRRRRI